MKRREFLKVSGAFGAGVAAWPPSHPFSGPAGRQSARPNILVFFTDDHGQWAQHAYGDAELRTPNLDRLARSGTRMTQAFTPCPVCSPARASFLTGRMPSQHGIHDWLEEGGDALTHPGLDGQPLIAELLKQADYRTGLVGKWHCGRTREPHPGFDRWFSYWVNQYPHRGEQRFSDQGQLVVEEGQQSPLLTRRAIDFLREHDRTEGTDGRPFFLFVGYVDTHSPHNSAPDELVEQYRAATFHDIESEAFAECHGRALIPVSDRPDVERRKHMQYYGAVSSLDREVGRIVAELERTGHLENTLIVYTSDHGLNCGQHGMWEKGNGTIPQNFLEESIRVPCTVSWPAGGIGQDVTCDDPVNHCDLWATLLDAAGAVPDEDTARRIDSPGRSYLPQLRGRAPEGWRETIIFEYGNARMARTGRYKLIERHPYRGVTFPDELYDLEQDPRETVNRYEDAALQAVIRDLSGELRAFFDRYTVAGRSGLDLESQPECTPQSPWIVAARENRGDG